MFGPEAVTVGNDILDMGSRKVEARAQQGGLIPTPMTLGMPGQFDLPDVYDPALFVRSNFASVSGSKDAHQAVKFLKGTTTLALKYKDGIVIAVDSRASAGDWVSSGSVNKFVPMGAFLIGTLAGGAADCIYWERNLAAQCRLYHLRNGKRISVAGASKLFARTLRSYKGYGLSIQSSIAGWDEDGAHLYFVDNEGTRLKGNYFSGGSGSTFAYGLIDNFYSEDMEEEEALALAKKAVGQATVSDAFSGGRINLLRVNKDGWAKVQTVDSNDVYFERLEAKKNAMSS